MEKYMSWGDINMENIVIENGKKYSISIDIPEINKIENIIERVESLENEMEVMKSSLKRDESSQVRIKELENQLNEVSREKEQLKKEIIYLKKESEEQLEKYKKDNMELSKNLTEIQSQSQQYRFKFEEFEREIYKIAEERDKLKVANNRLKEDLENLNTLFKPCENIIESLLKNISLNDLRDSLKISFKDTLENKFKILYTLENSDKFLSEVASYYSRRQQAINGIDKVFIGEINGFYGKIMLFLPNINDEFDISKMYDIETTEKRFKRIKEVYSPGILSENGVKVKAKVKGINE